MDSSKRFYTNTNSEKVCVQRPEAWELLIKICQLVKGFRTSGVIRGDIQTDNNSLLLGFILFRGTCLLCHQKVRRYQQSSAADNEAILCNFNFQWNILSVVFNCLSLWNHQEKVDNKNCYNQTKPVKRYSNCGSSWTSNSSNPRK